MKIVKAILDKNPCYTRGRKLSKVEGLQLHSVGCSQPNAQVFVNNWNTPSHDWSCVHGFIDANTGDVYQTLPWDWRGWHSGGASNNTHIGVEMCESNYIKYTGGASFNVLDWDKAQKHAKVAYDSAVELFAYLCKEYKLDPLGKNVIISHAEGYKLGLSSNHGDPEHYWKQLKLTYTMVGFRADVNKKLKESEDDDMTRFKKLEDIPAGFYRDKIAEYVSKGYLSGKGDGVLDLTEDMIRTMIICERITQITK